MIAEAIFFTILAAVAIGSALLMITRRHPLSSALSLVVTFIALAGLYGLLSAKLVFLMQILVYAGAIMSLVIFTIMLLNVQESDLPLENKLNSKVITSLIMTMPIVAIIIRAVTTMQGGSFSPVDKDYGTVKSVGLTLFQKYAFPFEVISILLLVALVGVVVLAKRRI